MRSTLAFVCCLLLLMLSANLIAETDAQTLQKMRPSVLKIETTATSATGFLWQDASHLVTSLHVVDGQDKIVVNYIDDDGKIYASSSAKVTKVLKAADLVLLEINRPQDLPALEIDTNYPKAKATLDALGFPLNIAAHSNTQVKVRFGGNTLKTILPQKVLAKLGEYPSPNTPILNLEGNLVPGLSGAPIINDEGRVVGVVDGGLENGAVGISWGIPADRLPLLLASTLNSLPNASGAHELFAADLDAAIAPPQEIGDNQLMKLRSRSFAQLAQTSDDIVAVTQLATLFAGFNPAAFEYDIYQEAASGATVVIPKGMEISQAGNFSVIGFPDSNMQVKFRIDHAENMAAAQSKSETFERELTEFSQGVQVLPDMNFSYLTPINRYGVTINRKALYRNVFNGFTWVLNKYYFETLASNGEALLQIAAVNNDSSPEKLQMEMWCAQAIQEPQCQYVFAERRLWAQMVLGVLFSSFPAQVK